MDGEIVVFLVPIGMLIVVLLLYRIARGPHRIYPASSLVAALAATAYVTLGAEQHRLEWFFIWFTLLVIPIGAIAHVLRRAVNHRSIASE